MIFAQFFEISTTVLLRWTCGSSKVDEPSWSLKLATTGNDPTCGFAKSNNTVAIPKTFPIFRLKMTLVVEYQFSYRTRVMMIRGLYTFYPLFEVHLCTVTCDLWPYVWLVFKSGF